MKKVWLVLLVLLVMGGSAFAQVWTTNAPANYKLILAKNEYGPGWQGVCNPKWLFNGQQVKAGEVYELEITFKSSARIKQLQVMLVDGSEAAKWWTELSTDKPVFEEDMPANTDITKKITFNANVGATGDSLRANQIVFDTQSAGTTLTFSKFTLKRIK